MKLHKGKIIDKVKKYRIVDCAKCGFIHADPIPTGEELEKIYAEDYYTEEKPLYIRRNLEDQEWWETVYKDRINCLEKFLKNPPAGGKMKRLLEIGSGPGLFLKYAKKKGWDVLGIEPSEQASKFSIKNKVPVIKKFYEEVDFKQFDQFDAVVMFEFLEHVPNPIDVIKLSYKVLKKGGVICIGVPNDYNPLQEVARKKLKIKPHWLAPPHHINYFTIPALKKLLQKNKFKVVHTETNFPLEMFLLMGENYIGNDKIGRHIHSKRKKFDLALSQQNNSLKLELYKLLADLNIGRDTTIYGLRD